MTRVHFVLIGVVFALVAAAIVTFSWLEYRAQPDSTHWDRTTAIVTAHRTINLNRGTATVVHAQYTVGDVVHEADIDKVRDVWSGERFVTPTDTPGVGSAIALMYDPADPRTIVPAERPRAPLMGTWTIVFVGALSLLALLCWFVPVRR